MKKVIILTLLLTLTFSLAACSFEFGGGTSDGDPTNSKTPSGNSTNSPGYTSDPSKPSETSKTPENNDTKLIGEWEWKQHVSPGVFDTHYVSFRDNGTFIFSATGVGSPYGLTGNYTVSGAWITLTNIVARTGEEVILEDWVKTVRVEYRFEKNPDGGADYLNMCTLLYDSKTELPLDFEWTRWTKK